MSSSSDNEFEDPYNISSEETVGPLEIENTDTIQAESPVGAEKPVEAKKGPRGRRRWWYVRGERICRRSAGSLLEVCQGRLSSPEGCSR